MKKMRPFMCIKLNQRKTRWMTFSSALQPKALQQLKHFEVRIHFKSIIFIINIVEILSFNVMIYPVHIRMQPMPTSK